MSSNVLVSIQPSGQVPHRRRVEGKVMLVKPPYFTPWTPPLGIGILKSFLAQHGFPAQCFDFNVDPDLWGMHHKYFAALQRLEDVSINDGYSKLWWILNAHMLAHANGADAAACARVLERVIPLYGIRCDRATVNSLLPLVERFFDRLDELTDAIDLSGFAVVGTSTYTTSLAASLFILRKVKRKYPHVKTVMGGGIFADDLALGSDNLTTLVEEHPYVDHVVLGEGEMLLLKLLDGELAHKRVISIADLKGRTLEMKDVPTPDFSDLEQASYYQLTIEGARSCPFQCSFCSETIQWGDYRKKPMDIFVNQVVELARRHGNNAFFMGDSLMNPYINQFAGELLGRGAGIVYDGYLRADKPVTNRKFVKAWADSGLYRVRLGIESAAARVLDSMDKMTTPAVISGVLKTLAGAGIRTTTYWIVGFPGETEEDFRETCDFIKEHHRFIYELEAHPYYYYPYGQIGSRLYQCHSLYPEDVTEVIKFKVWDIDDAEPSREVRYERLRRISKLAADLGLPNIYTMADRYKAEERWHGLHPHATEVYKGTRVSREKARPRALAAGRRSAPAEGRTLCYQVTVAKKLDEAVLAEAVEQLVAYNETLQSSPAVAPEGASRLVGFYHEDGGPGLDPRALVEELAPGVTPAQGAPLRVACVSRDGGATDVFLLVHDSAADPRGLTLLCEDLFRAYEQLSEGRPVSLSPVEKTFGEFAEESPDLAAEGVPPAEGSRGVGDETAALLDGELMRRFVAGEFDESGARPVDFAAAVVLRSLAEEAGGESVAVDLLASRRLVDHKLARTVGPPGRLARVPAALLVAEGMTEARGVPGRVVEEVFACGVRGSRDDSQPGATRVLLNLEYVADEPWLGGNEWRPRGFVLDACGPREGYALEVVPLFSDGSMEVRLRSADDGARSLAARLAARLPAVADSTLNLCADHVAAKRYWLGELGHNAPRSNVEMDGGTHAASDADMASQPCELDESSVRRLCADSGAPEPAVLLAAYALLLSRLSGRQDVVIASHFEDHSVRGTFPVRLRPSWARGFGDFLAETGRKVAEASRHADLALEILGDEHLLAREEVSRLTFDVGFVYGPPQGADATRGLKGFGGSLSLALVGERDAGGLALRVVFDRNRFDRATVERFCSYLRAVLSAAAEDALVPAGEIRIEEAGPRAAAPGVVAADVFSFE